VRGPLACISLRCATASDAQHSSFLGARASGPHKQCVARSRHMRLPQPCQAPACGGKPAPVKDGYHCIGKTYHMVLSTLCRGGPLAYVPIGPGGIHWRTRPKTENFEKSPSSSRPMRKFGLSVQIRYRIVVENHMKQMTRIIAIRSPLQNAPRGKYRTRQLRVELAMNSIHYRCGEIIFLHYIQ
jgi:hypothetical protein